MAKGKVKGFKFRPFSVKQKKLLTWWLPGSPYYHYEMVIAEGSIRAGKTIACIDSFLTWSLSEFDGESFILGGRSIGALKRNVLKPMFQILKAKGIEYNYVRSDDHYIQIGNNIYYCFGGSTEASQDTVQGLTAAGAYLDEVAIMPYSFVDQVIGRCSVDGARIFFNCNPEGPYHWFKTDFIDQAKQKRALVLHFTMDDNLTLSERVKNRFKRMFSGVFYNRNILGLWVMAEGVIYDMFDEDRHVFTDKDTPGDFQEYQVWIDHGSVNPTVFLLVGKRFVDGEPDYWILKEYYYDSKKHRRQKADKEYYSDLVEFTEGYPVDRVIVDAAAQSFLAEIRGHGRYSAMEAKKDVRDGITATQTVISGGRLHVHESCSNVKREFSSYVWDEKAQNRGEDKPLKENDHTMDSIRYGVMTQSHANVRIIEFDEDDEDEDDLEDDL